MICQTTDDAAKRTYFLLGKARALKNIADIAHHDRALFFDPQKSTNIELALQVLEQAKHFLLVGRPSFLWQS